jgi:hypothetical protein
MLATTCLVMHQSELYSEFLVWRVFIIPILGRKLLYEIHSPLMLDPDNELFIVCKT